MRYCLTKEQSKKLMDAGVKLGIENITPYEEIIRTHEFIFRNGRYIIYKNPGISDLFSMILPFIMPDGDIYQFEIKQNDEKWVVSYTNKDKKDAFSATEDEFVDALFDTCMFLLEFSNKSKHASSEFEPYDDYLFTGRI